MARGIYGKEIPEREEAEWRLWQNMMEKGLQDLGTNHTLKTEQYECYQKHIPGSSLAAQWLILYANAGDGVQSLIREISKISLAVWPNN